MLIFPDAPQTTAPSICDNLNFAAYSTIYRKIKNLEFIASREETSLQEKVDSYRLTFRKIFRTIYAWQQKLLYTREQSFVAVYRRLIMELELKSLFGLHVHSCTAETPQPPAPPAFGLICQGASGQPRQTTSLCDPLLCTRTTTQHQHLQYMHTHIKFKTCTVFYSCIFYM